MTAEVLARRARAVPWSRLRVQLHRPPVLIPVLVLIIVLAALVEARTSATQALVLSTAARLNCRPPSGGSNSFRIKEAAAVFL